MQQYTVLFKVDITITIIVVVIVIPNVAATFTNILFERISTI